MAFWFGQFYTWGGPTGVGETVFTSPWSMAAILIRFEPFCVVPFGSGNTCSVERQRTPKPCWPTDLRLAVGLQGHVAEGRLGVDASGGAAGSAGAFLRGPGWVWEDSSQPSALENKCHQQSNFLVLWSKSLVEKSPSTCDLRFYSPNWAFCPRSIL